MDVTDEKLILSNLIIDEEYISQVLPFLQPEYFQNKIEKISFEVIRDYIQIYNTLPNRTTIVHDLREKESLNDHETQEAEQLIKEVCNIERPTDRIWLVKKTEEFCQSKAVYNAIIKAISIYDGSETEIGSHAIPDLIKEAISISFDSHIGMDFYSDANTRYDYYTLEENKISFDLGILNAITNGGLGRRSLNIILGGLHVGKTLLMISMACDYIKLGYNVLYLTMELREEEILMRMDANLLKTPINKLKEFSRDSFIDRVEKIRQKSYGQIKVKEFPTGASHSGHFKHIIDELKLKHNFIPSIIFVDYMGIMGSSRMKMGTQNSYFYLKAVSEELRALAQETDTVLWSAMQMTRCLSLDTKVILENNSSIEIKELKIGNRIKSNNGFVEVLNIFPKQIQKAYKIRTKSGKEIICSGKHIFPTESGEKSIYGGLSTKDKLISRF